MLWMENFTHLPEHYYAATSSTSSPSTNFLFLRTSIINWWPFNFFQVLAASIVSLKTMESIAVLDPHPFVLLFLSLIYILCIIDFAFDCIDFGILSNIFAVLWTQHFCLLVLDKLHPKLPRIQGFHHLWQGWGLFKSSSL